MPHDADSSFQTNLGRKDGELTLTPVHHAADCKLSLRSAISPGYDQNGPTSLRAGSPWKNQDLAIATMGLKDHLQVLATRAMELQYHYPGFGNESHGTVIPFSGFGRESHGTVIPFSGFGRESHGTVIPFYILVKEFWQRKPWSLMPHLWSSMVREPQLCSQGESFVIQLSCGR